MFFAFFRLVGFLSGPLIWVNNDIRVNKEEKKKAMARVTELSTKVSELEKAHSEKESELETDLDAEITRAINAEKAAEELRKEVDGIKKK